VVSGGRKKVHTTFDDGSEMVEEYDEVTLELLVRKKRTRTALGKEATWEYMVGHAPEAFNPDTSSINESSLNPIFSRKDSKLHFEWRVRNVPYPPGTFSVEIDDRDRKIVIRTSNKKYYKKFNIAELDHLNRPLEEDKLQWKHANNTLHIMYKKPKEVVDSEIEDRKALKAAPKNAMGDNLRLPPSSNETEGCKQQ